MKAIVASGKRKTAVARATLTKGRGVVRINSVPVEMYPFELGRLKILEPLKLAGRKVDSIDIDVNVHGGGVMGQADAVRTAIARGLVQYLNDQDLETLFREYDRTLIVPDTRRKLPKNPLGRGARKKRQNPRRRGSGQGPGHARLEAVLLPPHDPVPRGTDRRGPPVRMIRRSRGRVFSPAALRDARGSVG